MTALQYRVEIPKSVLDDPVQAIVDGLTVLHDQGGIRAVETALESVLTVVYETDLASRQAKHRGGAQ